MSVPTGRAMGPCEICQREGRTLHRVRRSRLLDEKNDSWICSQDAVVRRFVLLRKWIGTLIAAFLEAWFH